MHRDQVRIAEPCPAAWDAMTGDEARRHCGACDRPVHNLSAMRLDDAAALLRARADDPPCVRYTAAADGTLRFRDLVPRASLTRKLRTAAAAALLAACTPHGESAAPELGDPPRPLHTARAPLPGQPRPAAPADQCDPEPPARHTPDSRDSPDATVHEPLPPTLEEQQRAAQIDRALLQVRDRLDALDTSVAPIGKLMGNLKAAHLQAEEDAAERARLLELERRAMESELD